MKKSLISLILIIISFLFFLSCSDTAPHISSQYVTFIYDFENYNEPANCKLSIYILPSPDVRRSRSIEIYNQETKFLWKIENPEIIEHGVNKYIGYSAIECPESYEFPDGQYQLRYYDLANREVTEYFDLNKLDSMKAVKEKFVTAEMVEKGKVGKECNQRRIVILDESYRELYFGINNSMVDTDEQILQLFPDAKYKRLYFCTQDNSIGILLPMTTIQDKDNN